MSTESTSTHQPSPSPQRLWPGGRHAQCLGKLVIHPQHNGQQSLTDQNQRGSGCCSLSAPGLFDQNQHARGNCSPWPPGAPQDRCSDCAEDFAAPSTRPSPAHTHNPTHTTTTYASAMENASGERRMAHLNHPRACECNHYDTVPLSSPLYGHPAFHSHTSPVSGVQMSSVTLTLVGISNVCSPTSFILAKICLVSSASSGLPPTCVPCVHKCVMERKNVKARDRQTGRD